jgi:hypothetical protein
VDLADFRQPGDPLDGVALALVDGLDGMREDAEIVGGGDADPRVTMIDAERRVRGVGISRVQRSSTGRMSESFLIASA